LNDNEMQLLGPLRKDDFDEREWAALQWARTIVLFEGAFPDPRVDAEFRSSYAFGERKAIFATVKLMLFFNMLANSMNSQGQPR